MRPSIRTSTHVVDRSPLGLLDTSVIIDLDTITAEVLPEHVAAADPAERARRQDRLQRVEAAFDPLPFDVEAARAYGRIYAAVRAHGRTPRRRLADLLIASVALANDLPVVTRNGADFVGLDKLVEIIEV
jgi:predicted nucleic acid-binding protein